MVIARSKKNSGLFDRQLLAYVESGFPLFAAMGTREHAVAVIGHGGRRHTSNAAPPPPAYFAPDLTEGLVVVDDNYLPYLSISGQQPSPYQIGDIDAFIVPLPEQ